MGQNLAYAPQEVYSDKPKGPDHKRANVFTGITAAEAILFGAIGLQTNYDGRLSINPKSVTKENISIKGFGFKGNKIDVDLSISKMKIVKNGKVLYEGIPKKIKVI